MFSGQAFGECSYSDGYTGEVDPDDSTLPIVIPLVIFREHFLETEVSNVFMDINSVSLTLDLFLPY